MTRTQEDTAISYDNFFFNNDNLKLFDASVSINHWQLRDVVKGSSAVPYKINYVYQNKVKSFSSRVHAHGGIAQPHKTTVACRNELVLNYRPKCFQEIDEFFVTAGILEYPATNQHIPVTNIANVQHVSNISSNTAGITLPASSASSFAHSPATVGGRGYPGYFGGLPSASSVNDWKGVLSLKHMGDQERESSYDNYSEEKEQDQEEEKNSGREQEREGKFKSRDSTGGTFTNVPLGKLINNDIALFSSTRGVSNTDCELFVCNNDHNLYHLNHNSKKGLSMLNIIDDLKTSLNSCNLSHDGTNVIVSGDSNKFAIYHHNIYNHDMLDNTFFKVSSGTNTVERISKHALDLDELSKINTMPPPPQDNYTLKPWKIYSSNYGEYGFSSCFNESNLQFTTVFQTGYGLVYDMRKIDKPLKQLISSRPNQNDGAFRVCKYSGDIDSLLFISENLGVVHVLDTKNFDNHYLVKFPNNVQIPKDSQHKPFSMENTAYSTNYTATPLLPSDEIEYDTDYSHLRSTGGENDQQESLTNENPNINYLTNENTLEYQNYLKPQLTKFSGIKSQMESNSSNVFKTVFRSPNTTRLHRINNRTSIIDFQESEQNDPWNITSDRNSTNSLKKSLNLMHIHTLHPENNYEKSGPALSDSEQARTLSNSPSSGTQTSKKRPRSLRFSSDVDEMNSPLSEHMRFSQLLLRESGLAPNSNNRRTQQSLFFNSNDFNTPMTSSSSSSLMNSARLITNRYDNGVLDEEIPSKGFYKIKDNDISGLDWVQDNEGSSLVVGTSLGIYKWGIKSSLRNSLSTYDFS